jgi:hypothetical protein
MNITNMTFNNSMILYNSIEPLTDVQIINNYCASLDLILSKLLIYCAIALLLSIALSRWKNNYFFGMIITICETFYTIGLIYLSGIYLTRTGNYYIVAPFIKAIIGITLVIAVWVGLILFRMYRKKDNKPDELEL